MQRSQSEGKHACNLQVRIALGFRNDRTCDELEHCNVKSNRNGTFLLSVNQTKPNLSWVQAW